jgi:ribonuclease J
MNKIRKVFKKKFTDHVKFNVKGMEVMQNKGFYYMPLGGTNEIGMNLNLFTLVKEDGSEESFILDAGVGFTRNFGVTVLYPSVDLIKDRNILGIICTHGHEDHIGAIPKILPLFSKKVPVYTTKFTAGLIENKCQEAEVDLDIRLVDVNKEFKVGSFSFTYYNITHSIPESNIIRIKCELDDKKYTLLHTGDWKFDDEPGPTNTPPQYELLKEIAKDGVDVLFCDSTNSLEEARSNTEVNAADNLEKVICNIKDKGIIVSCFASNIARLAAIIAIAKKFNKTVYLLGTSLHKMYDNAIRSGYLKHGDCHKNITNFDQSKSLIVATGSQGEPSSALQKLASLDKRGPHKSIDFAKMVIIFSSRIIPGNELDIIKMKNIFLSYGTEVIDNKAGEIHASGHPSRPEIRKMIEHLPNLKSLIPVEGDLYHTTGTAKVGRECGIKNILIPNNGAIIQLGEKPEKIGQINIPIVGVDGNQVVELESRVISERQHMSTDGCVFVHYFKGQSPRILDAGVTMKSVNDHRYKIISKEIMDLYRENKDLDDQNFYKNVRNIVLNYYQSRFGKSPLVLISIR